MRNPYIFYIIISLSFCACGESGTDDAEMINVGGDSAASNNTQMPNAGDDSTAGDLCAEIEENDNSEPKFTQVVLRDVSDSGCPMLAPEDFDSDGEDDEDDEDITVCASEIQDNPVSLCSFALRCTSTDSEGMTSEYQVLMDLDEDETFTGVLEVEISGIFCSYGVSGTIEQKN